MSKIQSWHQLRKLVHLFCFLAFVALPFFDVVRFDIPRQRFYFAGYELWINEFAIVFFALMFLMFLVVVSSVFYGRVYCGYLCPQMIFSEASMALEARLRRLVTKSSSTGSPSRAEGCTARYSTPSSRRLRSCWRSSSFPISWSRATCCAGCCRSTSAPPPAFPGAAVTLSTFLDFSLVRLRFCTTVCPYGYLQGMLGDRHTLLVHYRDETHQCIECKKCVRVCPMGIDIRKSPFQIECVHCADCIDACDEILGKLGKPGLIHYVWGEKGPLAARAQTAVGRAAHHRAAAAAGLCVGPRPWRSPCAGRCWCTSRPSAPNSIGWAPTAASTISSATPSPTAASKPATVAFSARELPGASLALAPNPVPVKTGRLAARHVRDFGTGRPVARDGDALQHRDGGRHHSHDVPGPGGEMKRVPVLIPFLALVSAIFIGILIFAYVETKKANPQMLDEQGHIVHGT